jgi:hypothetical protein
MSRARWLRRWRCGDVQAPQPVVEAMPAATLSDADVRRLAVGVMLAAVDGDDDGIRAALSGLPASDLIELAGELGGLGSCARDVPGVAR